METARERRPGHAGSTGPPGVRSGPFLRRSSTKGVLTNMTDTRPRNAIFSPLSALIVAASTAASAARDPGLPDGPEPGPPPPARGVARERPGRPGVGAASERASVPELAARLDLARRDLGRIRGLRENG